MEPSLKKENDLSLKRDSSKLVEMNWNVINTRIILFYLFFIY